MWAGELFLRLLLLGSLCWTYAACEQFNCNDYLYNVSASEIDGDVKKMLWVPSTESPRLIGLLLTLENTIYRTNDGGVSWTPLRTIPEWDAPATHDCPASSCWGVLDMVTNADESRITMFGYDGRIWMTEDGGDTFEFFRHMGILFSKLIPHPTDPEYLLAVHVSRCCWSPDISKCSTCSHSVSGSEDHGRTWSLISRYVMNGENSVGWGPQLDRDVSAKVLLAAFVNTTGDQRLKNSNRDDTKVTIVQDFRKPSELTSMIAGGISAFTSKSHIYVVVSDILDKTKISLLASGDAGRTWSRTTFESPRTETVGVLRRWESDQLDTDVYIAEAGFPTVFHHSLASLLNGQPAEWTSAQGTPMVLFANHFDARYSVVAKTSVSWNGGRSWSHMSAPNSWKCSESPCFLHSSNTEGVVRVATNAGAPGLVLLSGNAGPSLNLDNNEQNVFISFDSGETWMLLKNGSHTVSFGPKGSSLIMIPDSRPTQHFSFSMNMGANLMECPFSSRSVSISELMPEPSGILNHFFVTTRDVNRAGQYRIHKIEVPDATARRCQYPDDYETWTPDHEGRDCILGTRRLYLRKKPSVECSLDPFFVPPPVYENCACMRQDFFCDACFVEVAGFCQLEYEYCPGHPALPRKGVDCLCGMSHYASRYTGYLKKPESVCTGGLDLTAGTRQYRCPAEVQVSCPPQTDHAQPPPVVQPQADAVDVMWKLEVSLIAVLGILTVVGIVVLVATGCVKRCYQSGRCPRMCYRCFKILKETGEPPEDVSPPEIGSDTDSVALDQPFHTSQSDAVDRMSSL